MWIHLNRGARVIPLLLSLQDLNYEVHLVLPCYDLHQKLRMPIMFLWQEIMLIIYEGIERLSWEKIFLQQIPLISFLFILMLTKIFLSIQGMPFM